MGKKNSKGGKGYRKMGKKNSTHNTKTALILKEEGEEYVKVEKMLGSGRINVQYPDGSKCIGIIPGRMRKKRFWISVGDILLVSVRDYQENRCDVLHRYSLDQVKTLKSQGDIVFSIDSPHEGQSEREGGIEFTDEVGDDSVAMGSYQPNTNTVEPEKVEEPYTFNVDEI